MGAGFSQVTDLYNIYSVVQNTMIRYPKDLIIASLREFFSQDSKYHFVHDEWGYPKTPDHTGLPLTAGLYDDVTTRVFIGENNRYDIIYYPAVLVSAGSFKYVPISLNRDQYNLEFEFREFVDGYGHRAWTAVPSKFVGNGAWEGNLTIEVQSRGIREIDDLVELISIYLTDLNWNNLSRVGVSIKPNLSIGSVSSAEDRNDKLFKRSITVDIRGEWRTEIPVRNIIDVINFCVEFGHFRPDGSSVIAPNIQINTNVDLPEAVFNKNLIRINEPEDE